MAKLSVQVLKLLLLIYLQESDDECDSNGQDTILDPGNEANMLSKITLIMRFIF